MADKKELIPLCRKSLVAYAIAQWPGYRAGDHHRQIADALRRVRDGTLKRLMIMMPPRHGKSMLASEFFPPWYFGAHPDHYIMHASYGQDLVDDFGRKIRNQLKDELYGEIFPGVGLSGDSMAVNKFTIDAHGGAYFATGVGGSATGRGAHLLLIDDPIKDRADADSDLVRKQLRDWYTSVAYTRLMPGGAIIVIQTRWHEDDLCGWLLKEHAAENWEVLSLPALQDEGVAPDPDNGIRGEHALWPASYPLESLYKIKATLSAESPRDWEAMYMQRPRPLGGGLFKRGWLCHYEGAMHSSGQFVIMLVDPASGRRKVKTDNQKDFTSIWIVGLGADENYYVLDMVRDRLNLTERAEAVFRLHRKWKPGQVRYEQYGMQADIEHLKSEMEKRKYRFAIQEVGGQVAKEDRIKRLIPLFQKSRVWLPKEHMYTPVEGTKPVDLVHSFIEEEYLAFPVGRHDDMLDALARIAEPTLDTPFPSDNQDVGPVLAAQAPLEPDCGY